MEERDFFISYTHENEADALWIADTLKANGYSVYIQARDILPGDNFINRMNEFLKLSRSFIAVWSKGYAESRYCMTEFQAAYNEWHNRRMKRVIPVCIEDYPMEPLYGALVHADLYGVDEAGKVRRLLRAVGGGNTPAHLTEANVHTTDEGQRQERTAKPGPGKWIAAVLALLVLIGAGAGFWWWKQSNPGEDVVNADEQSADELFNLGVNCYLEEDYEKARACFEQAAEKGSVSALDYLGDLYLNGRGVDRDDETALNYFEQATEKGSDGSFTELGYMYANGYGVEIDYDKAREYWEQGAENGNANCIYCLGWLYENGNGVEQDSAKAREYYEQAAEKGNQKATDKLKELDALKASRSAVANGKCGDSAGWTLYDDGELYIFGTGDMDNWDDPNKSEQNPSPKRPGWETLSNTIQTVVIQDGITSIGNYCFTNYSGLTSVKIPESVTRINFRAFENCTSLSDISLPDSILKLELWAFHHCDNLTNVTIPEGVTEISGALFYECGSLTEVKIPEGVTVIHDWAFAQCGKLAEVTIPEKVTKIEDHAFYFCSNLSSIVIPDNVEEIGEKAFSACIALKTVSVPSGIEIADNAFPEGVDIVERM